MPLRTLSSMMSKAPMRATHIASTATTTVSSGVAT
jgi:hypothetical protein